MAYKFIKCGEYKNLYETTLTIAKKKLAEIYNDESIPNHKYLLWGNTLKKYIEILKLKESETF
jgi:hypothetical protein